MLRNSEGPLDALTPIAPERNFCFEIGMIGFKPLYDHIYATKSKNLTLSNNKKGFLEFVLEGFGLDLVEGFSVDLDESLARAAVGDGGRGLLAAVDLNRLLGGGHFSPI